MSDKKRKKEDWIEQTFKDMRPRQPRRVSRRTIPWEHMTGPLGPLLRA